MLLATKDEAGVHLDEEENDFMLDNAHGDNTLEELSAAVIMMAHIQLIDDKFDAKPLMMLRISVSCKSKKALLQWELETCKEWVKEFENKPDQFLNYKEAYEKLQNKINVENEQLYNEKEEIRDQILKSQDETLKIKNETESFKKAFKAREDKYLEDIVTLEEKLKSHDQIVYKMSHSLQIIHMLGKKPSPFYDPYMKTGLGYQNPKRLKKAIEGQPKMYDGEKLKSNKLKVDLLDYEETLEDAKKSIEDER
ncbi:hypothetical protein Tco_1549788 [Tanacetum coccineum]